MTAPARPTEPDRVSGALLGLFIGDALAMPVHWYYDRAALVNDYGPVNRYLPPKNPHPDSILWRSHYTAPSPAFDILGDQSQYWGQRHIHYHQFLAAGENTLNLKLCHVLVASLETCGTYDSDDYLSQYISFMTTPDIHRDTYIEECHRNFFDRFAAGRPAPQCGGPEKHIGGLPGMVPLLVRYRHDPQRARRHAGHHLSLTHQGQPMETAADALIRLLLPVLNGESLQSTIQSEIDNQANPLFGHPFRRWLHKPDAVVIGQRLSPACYVEDAVPAVIYLALKYANDPEAALVVNTALGGDNAHRGAVLGALLGAENGMAGWPAHWTRELRQSPAMGIFV